MPEELVAIGFDRSRVVMMNEAHNGLRRCVRTREIGRRILPTAHNCGVRHFALEALKRDFAEVCNRARHVPEERRGYLAQPDMRALIQESLDLGWTVLAYEADPGEWLADKYGTTTHTAHDAQELERVLQADLRSIEYTNWRELMQARRLAALLASTPQDTKLLVWCGNAHHTKMIIQDWIPMGYQFMQVSGTEHFVIDQIRSVRFDVGQPESTSDLAKRFRNELERRGGTAGFLREEAPPSLQSMAGVDAYLLSLFNDLE
jgi:hypothetical protein